MTTPPGGRVSNSEKCSTDGECVASSDGMCSLFWVNLCALELVVTLAAG